MSGYWIVQHVGVDPVTGAPAVSLSHYNVVDANDNVINDSPLTLKAAERLLKEKRAEPDQPKRENPVSNQDAAPEQGKIRWKKIGGGSFRMQSGRIIKPQEVFTASEDEIPKAFRDVVIPLDELPKEPPLEIVDPGFEIRSSGPGWYKIYSKDGKCLTDKAMRQAEAQAKLQELVG